MNKRQDDNAFPQLLRLDSSTFALSRRRDAQHLRTYTTSTAIAMGSMAFDFETPVFDPSPLFSKRVQRWEPGASQWSPFECTTSR